MKKQHFLVGISIILLLLVSQSLILAAPNRQSGQLVHYVDYGEDLYLIADRYGVSVELLLRANGLTDPVQIYVGFPLIIPLATAPEAPVNQPAQPAAQPNPPAVQITACNAYHTIQAGESLSIIAWDYNITVSELLRLNDLANADLIYAGQRLCLPGQAPAVQPVAQETASQAAAPPAYYHMVAEGETLIGIALRYGLSYFDIQQANAIEDADTIIPGQRLFIPGYQPPEMPEEKIAPEKPVLKPIEHQVEVIEEKVEETVPATTAPAAVENEPLSPTVAELMALPRAKEPLTIKVNDGETWLLDDVVTVADPENNTTLIVTTDDEFGRTVRVRNGGYEVRGQSEFVVTYIAPVGYEVWIDDPDRAAKIGYVEVKAGQKNYANFTKLTNFEGQRFASPDGWVLAYWQNPSKLDQRLGGWSNILVRTPSAGLKVKIESEGGGYKAECMTGSKGGGACDLAGLNAAWYTLWIDGTDFTIQTYMDGNAYAEFVLAQQPARPVEASLNTQN